MSERQKLEQAIVALNAQRPILGDIAVEAALAGLRQKLADLESSTALPTVAVLTPTALAGERKLVTVLFADISGFTDLSEKMDPEQVRSLINSCFDCLVPVVEKYGGTIDKFIGDEIMALFGAPATHESDAERALRAALDMMAALLQFNHQHATNLGMHIGINTGLVIAGGLGSEGRQQYSVMGDTVNLAARLEDASKTGQILVGSNTYRLTSPLFDFETLPPIRVKGKAEPVAIYQLMKARAMPGSTRGIAGLRSPLVGRDGELQRLQTAINELTTGKGGTIAIIGEPGLGKSRLVAEVHQSAPPGVRWAEGRALSYTERTSYRVAQCLLDSLIDVSLNLAPVEIGARLRATAEQFFGEKADNIYPYLARLRETPLDRAAEEAIEHLLPEALQRRMHHAFREFVRAQGQTQPTTLVWEDLHWSDASSLLLLESLLPLATEVPLLLLLVFRTHEGQLWQWHRRLQDSQQYEYQVIELLPLTSSDSIQLIDNLLKIEEMPEATRQLILSKAEGNPFFLEELLRSLVDAGLVLLEGDRAIITHAIEQIDIPDTLQGVIAARIDHLPPEDKYTLQTASVIGRVFQEPVLAYLVEQEQTSAHLSKSLHELRRRELVHQRVEAEYVFKHAVTQEVSYNSLLMTRRKMLHRVTAEAIEGLFPHQLDELSSVLAYHYQRAEMRDNAFHYLNQAAERARKTYSNTEAISLYRSALDLAHELQDVASQPEQLREQAIQLRERLGDVLALTGEYEAARRAYEEAREWVPALDRIRQSRFHRKEGNTWIAQRLAQQSLQAYDVAESVLLPRPSTPDLAWQHEWLEIQLDRIWAGYWGGPVHDMEELAEKTRPVIQQHGVPAQRAKFFRGLALVAIRQGLHETDKTLDYAQASMAASQESGDMREIAFSAVVLGFCHTWRYELDQAETSLQVALKLAEQTGDVDRQVLSLSHVTTVYRLQGKIELVRHYALRALTAATDGKLTAYIGMSRAHQAWVAWREGNLAQAQALGHAALEAWGQRNWSMLALALWPLVGVTLTNEQEAEAFEYTRPMFLPSQKRLPQSLEAVLQDALQAWDGGNEETARALMKQAVASATQFGYL